MRTDSVQQGCGCEREIFLYNRDLWFELNPIPAGGKVNFTPPPL